MSTFRKLFVLSALFALAAVGVMISTSVAAATTITYTGQGFDSSDFRVIDERCGADGQGIANDGGTGQFAAQLPPFDSGFTPGSSYLVWVLTANGATSANLNLPDGSVSMYKVGGTYKYASKYYSLAQLLGPPAVTATYEGGKGKATLTVSHGCAPLLRVGAWCSPGYWKNAGDGAWALVGGLGVKSQLFNSTVVPDFYENVFTSSAFPSGPTILQALDSSGAGGANKYGSAAAPYGLNAFNATGAYLTSSIPCNPNGTCYYFDVSQVGQDPHNCPIDNSGNYKIIQP